jgi:adenylyltransferase/sulfurtransferase
MPSPPPPGSSETCDTAGVIGPAVSVVASMQAAIALRILVGQSDQIERRLSIVDVWTGSFRPIDVSRLRDSGTCPACHNGERLWLHGSRKSASTILCGRNAVQITPTEKVRISLTELASRLESAGIVTSNPFLVRVTISGLTDESRMELTVFPDGRAIIRGTEDPAVARSVYSRYIGT